MTTGTHSPFLPQNGERDETRSRAIRICLLGAVITIKGFIFGIALAVSIGFSVVWLHGDRILRLVEGVAQGAPSEMAPGPSVSKGGPPPGPNYTQPTTASPKDQKPSSRPQVVGQSLPIYQPAASKLFGRVLPLRAAPDPYSAMIVPIPPSARGIEVTGRTALYHEPAWLFPRAVLWREVIFQGATGWVCDRYLELQ